MPYVLGRAPRLTRSTSLEVSAYEATACREGAPCRLEGPSGRLLANDNGFVAKIYGQDFVGPHA